MTKSEFISRANTGAFEVEGVKIEIEIQPDNDGDDFITVFMHPITPLHCPTYSGQKWLKHTDESEFLTFENEVKKHKDRAEEFYKQAQRVAKATLKNGYIKILELPESIRADFDFYEDKERREKAIKRYIQNLHPIKFINDKKSEFFALGEFSLDLDGVLYVPHWSYWLDRPYYITTQQIIESVGE